MFGCPCSCFYGVVVELVIKLFKELCDNMVYWFVIISLNCTFSMHFVLMYPTFYSTMDFVLMYPTFYSTMVVENCGIILIQLMIFGIETHGVVYYNIF